MSNPPSVSTPPPRKSFWTSDHPVLTKLVAICTVASGIGTCVAALFGALMYFDVVNKPTVGLQFTGYVLGYMKPDFTLQKDMKLMGYKETNPNLSSMTEYSILQGRLSNVGGRDAEDVEVKVPVEAVMRHFVMSDHEKNPELLSEQIDKAMRPDKYVSIGELRADDTRQVVIWYSPDIGLDHVTFRFKQGEETKTVRYKVGFNTRTGKSFIQEVAPWSWVQYTFVTSLSVCAFGVILFIGGKVFTYLRKRFTKKPEVPEAPARKGRGAAKREARRNTTSRK